nr:DUF4435 domain-containing protein [Marinobacter sp. BGYM27]
MKHPSYKGKALLVVEGSSDVRLFRSLLCVTKVKIESVQGKIELATIVNELKEDTPSIFGLRDADFDRLLGSEPPEDYIFITDEHDAEIMMIRSRAFDSFLAEFSKQESHEELQANLRNEIFKAGYVIGLFRLVNELDELKLKFRSISFSGFCNVTRSQISIDRKSLAQQLIARSPNIPTGYSAEKLLTRVEEIDNQKHCELQLCSGHDLAKVMELVFSQTWASVERNMNTKKIESSLRLCFSRSEFEETQLYNTLKEAMSDFGGILSSNNTMQPTAIASAD